MDPLNVRNYERREDCDEGKVEHYNANTSEYAETSERWKCCNATEEECEGACQLRDCD